MADIEFDMRCNGCGKRPHDIAEYVEAAEECEVTPDEYVLQEEGTLNLENYHFWCTSCYVRVGCPRGVAK